MTLRCEEMTTRCIECEAWDNLRPWKLQCEECAFRVAYDLTDKDLRVACANGTKCP